MRRLFLVLSICLALVIGLTVYLKIVDKSFRSGVIFFNIGQGDSAFIRLPTGQKIVVDCGPDKKVLSRLGKYLPFYDRKIDYLIISHFDLDHYGGCADVLKRYRVENIVVNGDEKPYDRYWQGWARRAEDERAETRVITDPVSWNFGSTTLEFLFPNKALKVDAPPGDGNNNSIVFRLLTPSTTVLFVGDAEEPLEKALMERYCGISVVPRELSTSTVSSREVNPCPSRDERRGDPLQYRDGCLGLKGIATSLGRAPSTRGGLAPRNDTFKECPALRSVVLKAGHHGSDSSSAQEFLQAVNPEKAVISVGRNNFGHPSLRVIRRLERLGIEVLRTDAIGDIIIEAD